MGPLPCAGVFTTEISGAANSSTDVLGLCKAFIVNDHIIDLWVINIDGGFKIGPQSLNEKSALLTVMSMNGVLKTIPGILELFEVRFLGYGKEIVIYVPVDEGIVPRFYLFDIIYGSCALNDVEYSLTANVGGPMVALISICD